MRFRRWKTAVVCVALVGLLTGCNAIGLNVETQLTPPDGGGEQDAIREALDAYISAHTASGETTDYTLKYPSSGKYLSAFITLDQVSEHTILSPDSTNETETEEKVENVPDTALAFYRRNTTDSSVHINLLRRKTDGSWSSVADVEGRGESVNRVEFGDLDADGTPELLIGWHLYNSRDSRLAIYDISSNLTERSFSAPYTDLVVGDITADGADDLLLLSLTTGVRMASVQMFSYGKDGVVTTDHTMLDRGIVSFGEYTLAKLDTDVNGVFVDCNKEQGAVVTELICWENGKLKAPLCDQEQQINSATAREFAIASRDIDGDGVLEWPVTTRMPGFEETVAAKTLWRAEWCYWDHAAQQVKTEFKALIPADDGYMLRLKDEWTALPAAYNVSSHVLTMYKDAESGEWLFRIGMFTLDKKDELPTGYVLLGETESACFAVCIAEGVTDISVEEFNHLFYQLPKEES